MTDLETTPPVEKRSQGPDNDQAEELTNSLIAEQPVQRPHYSIKNTLYAWTLEILSLIIAAVALVGIAVFLIVRNNRPLPDWPYDITINTVISLLQQALSLGLSIPIGAAIAQSKWVWFSKRPHQLIDFDTFDGASQGPWGSSLFLLNLNLLRSPAALGSFLTIAALAVGPFTQQLISTPEREISVGIATVPQSTTYDAYSFGGIQATKTVDLTMKAAIYNGIYNTDPSLLAVQPNCATGNCTWPIFSSLGVCSDCVNRTDLITKNCSDSRDCSFSLPNVPTTIHEGSSLNIFINATTASNMSGLPSFDSTITQFQVMVDPDGGVGNTAPLAFGCSLYYCIKTYQTSVRLGNLTEEILFTYPNSSTAPQAQNINVPIVLSQDGNNYTVGVQTAVAMSSYVAGQLTGSGNGGIGEQTYTSDSIQAMYNAMITNSSNITTFMRNLATSMTNSIRLDTGSSGTTFANGTALKTEAYLTVSWAWISLPVAVWVLHLFCLVVVIWQTYKERIESFKSSTVSTIFVGLTQQKKEEVSFPVASMDQMETAAKQLQVSLKKEDGEYRLA